MLNKKIITCLICFMAIIGSLAPAMAQTITQSFEIDGDAFFKSVEGTWDRRTTTDAIIEYVPEEDTYFIDEKIMIFVPRHYDGMPFDKSKVTGNRSFYDENGNIILEKVRSLKNAHEVIFWRLQSDSKFIIIENIGL